ncbi:MAG: hypothetical protein KGH72_03730 [Candidatus Micrarchaeota archaeon]|nr:hypothetical protein [Candidatus Micrarchaeota archaeon]
MAVNRTVRDTTHPAETLLRDARRGSELPGIESSTLTMLNRKADAGLPGVGEAIVELSGIEAIEGAPLAKALRGRSGGRKLGPVKLRAAGTSSEESRERIRRSNLSGLNDSAIAREIGVSRTTIRKRRREMGLGPVRKHYTGEEIKEQDRRVRELHGQGLNDREMAVEFTKIHGRKVSAKTVRKWRIRAGLEPNGTAIVPSTDEEIAEQNRRVLELRGQGLSDEQIALELSVSQSTANRWRIRAQKAASQEPALA